VVPNYSKDERGVINLDFNQKPCQEKKSEKGLNSYETIKLKLTTWKRLSMIFGSSMIN